MSEHPLQEQENDTSPDITELAEETAPEETRKVYQPSLYTATLMDIFNFNETDLEANRRGIITNAQKRDVQESVQQDSNDIWQLVTIFLGVTLLIAVITAGQDNMVAVLIGAGIMIGPLLWIGYRRQNRAKVDLEKPRVKSIRGAIQPTSGITSGYTLSVKDKRFDVSMEQWQSIARHQQAYAAVYYLPNSNRILSAEILQPSATEKAKMGDQTIIDRAEDALNDADTIPAEVHDDEPAQQSDARQ